MGRVWVLGSLNIDVTYTVDELPAKGLTISATGCFQLVGGKGTNQAVAACWAGAETSLVGATGDDSNGELIRRKISEYPIDTSSIKILPHTATGTALILVEKSGANLIVVNGGANRKVPLEQLEIMPGDFAVAQLETNMDAVEYFFKQAKEKKAITVLNPSPYRNLPRELTDFTDIVIANEYEMGMLTGSCVKSSKDITPEVQEKLDAMRLDMVITTFGEAGIAVYQNGRLLEIPGHPVNVVDTQGAGDAFLGVLIGSMAQGMDAMNAAGFANFVASECVKRCGSTLDSLPDSKKVVASEYDKLKTTLPEN